MEGETRLATLLKTMKPILNKGEFVFCTLGKGDIPIDFNDIILTFKEEEGITLVIAKNVADRFHLHYSYVAAWITLTVHSSLDAIGLTAAFSNALGKHNISCNVVAGYYHDHIFVGLQDADNAVKVLEALAGNA